MSKGKYFVMLINRVYIKLLCTYTRMYHEEKHLYEQCKQYILFMTYRKFFFESKK